MQFPAQLEKIIRHGYDFRFGDYISRGFDLVQKNLGLFIVFCLIYFIINFAADKTANVFGYAGIGVEVLFSVIISPCLLAGFYYTAHKTAENDSTAFDDFFKGFDWVKPLTISALIQFAITMLCFVPMIAFGAANWRLIARGDFPIEFLAANLGTIGFLYLALMIPLIYLAVAWSFAPFLIIFHDMEAWPALEASRQIVSKKWFTFFGFFIVIGLIAILGVLGLIVGLLFTIPAALCMFYAAFRDVVGVPYESADDILDHLITEI